MTVPDPPERWHIELRKLVLLCVAITLVGSCAVAQQEISVNVMHQGARLLVPARAVFESAGATVEWFADSNAVHITSADTVVVISVGETDASINDELVTLDVPARIWDACLLVPVRFVGEALGRVVSYQGDRVVLESATDEDIVLRIASRVVVAPPRARPEGERFVRGCASCGR